MSASAQAFVEYDASQRRRSRVALVLACGEAGRSASGLLCIRLRSVVLMRLRRMTGRTVRPMRTHMTGVPANCQ